MVLHFFEERMAMWFAWTCDDMRVPQSVQKTEDAPRWHVKADCQDEKVKRALVEEWSRRSIERHG